MYRHWAYAVANYRTFIGIPDFVQHFPGIFYYALDMKGQAIIQIGIILLIATPILRVVCSAIGFVLEKDYLYTGISALVFVHYFYEHDKRTYWLTVPFYFKNNPFN